MLAAAVEWMMAHSENSVTVRESECGLEIEHG